MRTAICLPETFNITPQSSWMKDIETQMDRYAGPCSGVLVDVGAHVGLVALRGYLAGFRKIYCYEPSGESYELLQQNFQEVVGPDLPGIQLHNLAVTDHSGQDFTLYDYDVVGDQGGSNTGMRSAGYRYSMRKPHSQVLTVGLEDVLSCHESIEYLKVDIEGGEYTAFCPTETLRELLGRVQNLSVELHSVADPTFFDVEAFERTHPYYSSAESAGPELIDFLQSCGFIDSTYEEAMESPTEEYFSVNRNFKRG